jgi:putative transcriptional regulator
LRKAPTNEKELFTEILESVREGGVILRGEKSPSRRFTVEELDVQQIRDTYRLSQKVFAWMLGISPDTLQNWEQRRSHPEGPARVLLQVATKHPEAVWDVIKPKKKLSDKKTSKTTKK